MMNFRLFLFLFAASSALSLRAEETAPKSRMKEVLKARASEEAKKQPAPPATSAPASAAKTKKGEETPASPAPTAKKETAAKDIPTAPGATAPKAAEEPPTVLPKVEVRKDRITELDRQLHEQAKEIRREKKNTEQTETDKALNHPKVSKILSIFGGESSQHRAGIAQERVELMEAESDLLEAISHAKSKEEKQELEKQLDQLKAIRRDLEKSLR